MQPELPPGARPCPAGSAAMGGAVPERGGYVDPSGSLGRVTCFLLQIQGKENQGLRSWLCW